jgi:hypothetical protein
MVRLTVRIQPVLWLFFLIVMSVTFQGCGNGDNTLPTVPSNLSATVATSQVGLSWSPSTDNKGVTGYKIFRNGLYLQSVAIPAALDSSVTGSTQYCYTVSAYDADGNESAQSAAICTSSPSTGISSQCSIIPETAAGLSGFVMRGPTVPVCSEGASCEEPFSAGFQIKENSVVVGAFRSTSEGCFAVQVPAGTYVIVPDTDAPIISPQSQTQVVTVVPDVWTQVSLTFDTGIR